MSRANSQNPNLDVQVEAFIRSLAAKGAGRCMKSAMTLRARF